MPLRALAWTILISGAVALGMCVKEEELAWQMLLESIPAAPQNGNATGLFGLGPPRPPLTEGARREAAQREQNRSKRAEAERGRIDRLAMLRAEARRD